MPSQQQISAGQFFTDGETVNDERLNGHVNNATLLVGAINGRDPIPTKTLTVNDEFLIYRASLNALRVTNVTDILRSNLPVEASTITTTGITTLGGNTNVTGNLAITGNITATGNITVNGTLQVGNATINGRINGTGAVTVSSGTNEERPSSPLTGAIRFNTTRSTLEVYNGTSWISAGSGYNGLSVYGVFEFTTGTGGFGYISTGSTGPYTGPRYQTLTPVTKTDKERWEINYTVITNWINLGLVTGIFPDTYGYTVKLVGSNGTTYASQEYLADPHYEYVGGDIGPEGGSPPVWTLVDNGIRERMISVVLGPEITFTNISLALVVIPYYSQYASFVLISPQTDNLGTPGNGGQLMNNGLWQFKQTASGKKWVSP